MRTRTLLIFTGAVALGLTACKKEFVEGDTILVNDTVTATNATTLSFDRGWGGIRFIGNEGDAWILNDTLGGLRIPFPVQPGDRLIATLQVGLQQLNPSHPCVQSLHVSMGSVLGDEFVVTPDSSNVEPFDGAFNTDSPWQADVLGRQFTRQQELTVNDDMPLGVVQTFVKVWSTNDDCTTDTVRCTIMNRSLTLTVLRP